MKRLLTVLVITLFTAAGCGLGVSKYDDAIMDGASHLNTGKPEKALEDFNRAIKINPQVAAGYLGRANTLNVMGRYEEAITMLEKAMRLNPYPPIWYYANLAGAYRSLERWEEAIQISKNGLEKSPNNYILLLGLTDAYVRTERLEEARETAKAVLKANPKFSVEQYIKANPLKDKSRLNEIAEALRMAGLK